MISIQKHKRFDIEAYYRNKTKTFWFGPKTEWNQVNLLLDQNVYIHLGLHLRTM